MFILSGIDGFFVNPHNPPIYSTGGRNPTATLSSTGGGSYLSPNSAYAVRREKSDGGGGGSKANRYDMINAVPSVNVQSGPSGCNTTFCRHQNKSSLTV